MACPEERIGIEVVVAVPCPEAVVLVACPEVAVLVLTFFGFVVAFLGLPAQNQMCSITKCYTNITKTHNLGENHGRM